ncbi:MAG TPA: hypothetical protein VE869_06015 [Gemmatimonas sp.]|nr:hypothetical protein [Gemmatimonas sp.]
MILADVRSRLGREDAQLVVRLVSRGSAASLEEAEDTLANGGLDPLLDDPRLLAGLFESRQGSNASLALLAYVLVRHALKSAGDDDRVMADYVAAILMHFGMRGRANQIAEHDDATYDTLASLGEEVEGDHARRSFLARAHLGNYALWMSGMFPDHIESKRWRRGGPDLEYFESMGQRGFRLAATHRMASERGMTPLYLAAAERFAVLRMALNRVSDRFLFPHVHTPERLMRQVRDESRWHFRQ